MSIAPASPLAADGRGLQLVRPLVLARDRRLAVPGELGVVLGYRGLQRGITVVLSGRRGAGVASLGVALVAAATAGAEWAGIVDCTRSLSGAAFAGAGVALDRLAVVRLDEPRRWAAAVATLLDGVALVLAELPGHVAAGDARRLMARARQRGAVLVVLEDPPGREWPAEAGLRLHAAGSPWEGIGRGTGFLVARALVVHLEGRSAGTPPHTSAALTADVAG